MSHRRNVNKRNGRHGRGQNQGAGQSQGNNIPPPTPWIDLYKQIFGGFLPRVGCIGWKIPGSTVDIPALYVGGMSSVLTDTPSKKFSMGATLFIIRFLSAILVVSEFVPDEGWQSGEVARWWVYGNSTGYLTWEWRHGLRSFAYPMMFVPWLHLANYLEIINPAFVLIVPRLAHAFLTWLGDICLISFCKRRFGKESADWVGFLLVTNWFIFYCGSRTLTNTVEMALCTIGLELLDIGCTGLFAACVGISFCLRPTSIVFWVPLVNNIFMQVTSSRQTLFKVLFICLCTLLGNTLVDYYFYERVTFTWWNFLKFNVLDGQSSDFGVHPYFWYAYSALPSILGVNVLPVFLATVTLAPRYFELFLIMFHYVLVFSLIGHKEIRFLLPIVPLCLAVAGDSWCLIVAALRDMRSHLLQVSRLVFLINLIANIGVGIAMCGYHQVGIKSATSFVHHKATSIPNPVVLVAMPCFSFPVHTYLNTPSAQIEYLTCAPKGLEFDSPNIQGEDFDKMDLAEFIYNQSLKHQAGPDFTFVYDHNSGKVINTLRNTFRKSSFKVCFDVSHTFQPFDNVGERVYVICSTSRQIRRHNFLE